MRTNNFGIIKVGAASPKMIVANAEYNASEIIKLINEAENEECAVITFPELCITGYTCGDLFNQAILIAKSLIELERILENTKGKNIISVIGMPIQIASRLYNCAVAIENGGMLGIVPKMHIPNYKEFYEKRWFSSGINISREINEISILGRKVPFGNLIFKEKDDDFSFGIEICEDLWAPIPPSSYLTMGGANLILNLSASNEVIGKEAYRRGLISSQSARCICGYVYASSGVHESTTDVVFGGDCIIAENGVVSSEGERFNRNSSITYGYIDIDKIESERRGNITFGDAQANEKIKEFRRVEFSFLKELNIDKYSLKINPHPFTPKDSVVLNKRCSEIFNIQVAGLAKRLEHTKMQKVIIGVSGGLDSTLALLVAVKTLDVLKISRENIIGITMPGFGTTDETYNNAVDLMKSLGVSIKEIDIKASCIQHFKDIEHDIDIHDITYENVQARERTQILMDYANKVNGLVIGTADLSELALGWCTYNGDHMSMYAVNASVPKTLVKFLVNWVAENEAEKYTSEILKKIIDQPISPELLPPDENGRINQKTENLIGPYELNDFFIYYVLRFGMQPNKVLFFAKVAFENIYNEEEIKKWLKLFYKRFFASQFKRSCLPDGPKVGSISLSPRGDWRMPSDADAGLWVDGVD